MARAEPGWQLIRGGRLVHSGQRRAPFADLLLQDGVIREVGLGLAAPEGARIVEAAGFLLHPGLVNAHTHGHGGLARGQGDRWTLELLLAAAPWLSGGRLLADKHLSTVICAAEMVAKGCTTAYDMTAEAPLPTVEGLDAAAEAYARVGMRGVIAPMLSDRSLYEAVPGLLDALPDALQAQVSAARARPFEEAMAVLATAHRGWRWAADDIRFAIGPTIPMHCTDAFLCACRDFGRAHALPMQMHVGESKVQAVVGMQRYGRTLVHHLDHLGLINEQFTAAHGVWLDDDDLRLLADRGASVAHNPGSNMKLGNGMFRLRRALDLGVNVGLGTDGVSSSDNSNMYEALRLAAMTSHVQRPDPYEWASAEQIWQVGTAGSARVAGFANAGQLAPGFQADIVFLDLTAAHWLPHNGTINQLVHAEDATAVRHVMIGGRWVYRDGRHTTLDMAKLAVEAEAARERLEEASHANHAVFAALEGVVASFCSGLAGRPYHLSRYVCEAINPGL